MTPERQNEIWAMLDAESKTAMSRLWHNTPSEKDETKLLEILFGSHNLTSQAEEKLKCESKGEGNHIPDTTKMVDYAQYRLDLTKEIAVAMIRNTYIADEFAENVASAANMANEIVKRLKETEI